MLQAERIKTALDSMGDVLDEIRQGYVDDGCLQDAVYLQGVVNNIVWKLNEIYHCSAKMDREETNE